MNTSPDHTQPGNDDENGWSTWSFHPSGGVTVFDDGEISIEIPYQHGSITADSLRYMASALESAANHAVKVTSRRQ